MSLAPLTSPDLPAAHGFFTRKGGFGTGVFASLNAALAAGEDPAITRRNRAAVAAHMGVTPEHLLTMKQVHSARVISLTAPFVEDARPEADAMVTTRPDLALGVLTADCLPVLFAEPESGVIGAAHAGWRGTLAGILPETVTAMVKLGADPARIIAAIGPGIGANSYAVDGGFYDLWQGKAPDSHAFFRRASDGQGFYFNLSGYAAAQLTPLIHKVIVLPHDTCAEDSLFFSHRRSSLQGESQFGRQISVIRLDFQPQNLGPAGFSRDVT